MVERSPADDTSDDATTAAASGTTTAASRWRRVKTIVRLSILALVAVGIARSVHKAMREFREQQAALGEQLRELNEREADLRNRTHGDQPHSIDSAGIQAELDQLAARRLELERQRFSLRDISPLWLLFAGAVYVLGLIPCWIFWHVTLVAMNQRPSLRDSSRAFFIGHLGKYVPGKALVVILRAGQIRGARVDTTVAAVSVFIETLTMMAVGASVAAAILLATSRESWLSGLAIALMLAAGIPTAPPIFRRIVRMFRLKRWSPSIDEAVSGVGWRLMGAGWLLNVAGWSLLGASLWCVLQSIPIAADRMPAPPEAWALVTATTALAMVAGFLSLLPGGFGVRDYLIIVLLSPTFGAILALCSALLLRIVWLVSEGVVSIILVLCFPRRGDSEATTAVA